MIELFPAIDLKDGKAVRLFKGRFDEVTVYDDNPQNRAKSFAQMGFKWLHIVDLDGALQGQGVNNDTVAAIRASVDIPIQLGGGIRTIAAIENWLSVGVTRVILGTIAAKNPEFVAEAAKLFPNQVAVGIDAINGKVATEGWATTTDIEARDLAKRFEGVGVCAIIATDIGRDGTKTGINVKFTQEIADAVSIPIIASGGLKGVEDLMEIRASKGTPIHGAILGKALYDGLIDAESALKAAR